MTIFNIPLLDSEHDSKESFCLLNRRVRRLAVRSHQEWARKELDARGLPLSNMSPSDDDGAVSARNTLSSLHTNSTLKSLIVSFAQTQKVSYVSAFRLKALKMLEEIPFLESLAIIENNGHGIEVEELLALISTPQLNATLKTLGFHSSFGSLHLTDDEANQLVSILRKTMGWSVSRRLFFVGMMEQSRPF
jgi:hypothetical protein